MNLAYRTNGLRSNPPLLLLHGFLGARNDWHLLVNELSSVFYLITIDLPGHGNSQSIHFDPASADPWEYVRQLIDGVIEQLDFRETALLGYSLGGRIAMSYALSRPEKISRLIIESAHPGLNSEKSKQERFLSDMVWAQRFATESIDVVLQDWYRQPVFSSVSEDDRQVLIIEKLSQSGKLLAEILELFSLAKQPDYSKALADTPFPVHYLFGENDKKYNAIGNQLDRVGCLRSLHKIKGAGHNIHRKQPEAMAAVIRSFL